MKEKLLIAGAGGHGRVVAETAILSGKYEVIGFLDDYFFDGRKVDGKVVLGTMKDYLNFKNLADKFVVAIGNNQKRADLFKEIKNAIQPALIIHPNAIISNSAMLSEGTVVLAGAVVSAGVKIGENSLINSMVLVDHDSEIGDHVHLAQGTIVGSNVVISQNFTSSLGELIQSGSKRN